MLFFFSLLLIAGVLAAIVAPIVLLSLDTVAPARSGLIDTRYHTLRARFLRAVEARGGMVEGHRIDAPGPNNEELFIDVAWFGSTDPRRVLLHISGTHGVEGYMGSAVQTQILEQGFEVGDDVAVVFVHALNPWGMAFARRVNESNVDLNRNFFSAESALRGAPEAYTKLYHFLNPEGAPKRCDSYYVQAVWNIVRFGLPALKQAIGGGQYEYEDGIYFGGKQMECSLRILKRFVEERLHGIDELYVVEPHSGLGEWGEDVLFWNLPPEHEKSVWLSQSLKEQLLSDAPAAGVGFNTAGDLQASVPKLLPITESFWIVQEFGTYDPVRMLRALRDESRYVRSGGQDLSHWSKAMLIERFTPGNEAWQSKVVARGVELFTKMHSLANRGYRS